MYAYTETELLRLARIRDDVVAARRWTDHAEAHRLAAQARSEAIARTLRAIGRVLGRVIAPMRAWIETRRTVAELEALDARTLADIGISRSDIPSVAAGLWMPRSRRPDTIAPAPSMPGNDNARKAAA